MKRHPKTVRGLLLKILYERYLHDPLEMLGPQDLLDACGLPREEVIPNVFYLGDCGLVELMTDHKPPLVAGVRIAPPGIDLVENHFEFNLRFPPQPGDAESECAELPVVVERLMEEAQQSALDGEKRRCLLRDVQYLRDELARPVERWRGEVIRSVLGWIDGFFQNAHEAPSSLEQLKKLVEQKLS